eukprot:CAMPEP_0113590638 /NCGR_PEP_ID=MMETSP0015_2-20120614/36792_1 /TAXON_ID=2838 /ORGANISM="Odontella" /LENGTH=659 /DNA_ID=CAMNT_0000496865 /DNA_START=123 /DNA_END=2102 /DNA_ORIENTATION=- /assembly_acc=CAM_ASM_000160
MPSPSSASGTSPSGEDDGTVLDRLFFRTVSPTDVSRCYGIERSSYPPDEAGTKSSLQYRQHHAAMFFRCAVLLPPEALESAGGGGLIAGGKGLGGLGGGGTEAAGGANVRRNLATESQKMTGTVIGYICSTRCWEFDHESMSVHDPTGPLLAVHSVVVMDRYRKMGIGTKMLKEYVSAVRRMELKSPLERIVLMSKADKLAFYVRAGFRITKPSPIAHGRETWYEGELEVRRRRVGGAGAAGAKAGIERRTSDGKKEKDRVNDDEDEDEDEDDGSRPCWIVDSFAVPGKAGGGNPAGVVLLPEETDPSKPETVEWMRSVAMEFNQSETAFVWERTGEGGAAPGGGANSNLSGSSSTGSGGSGSGAPDVPDHAHYNIKYLTCSGAEVDLCGHATLASASVLFDLLGSGAGGKKKRHVRKIVFRANRDSLKVRLAPDASTGVQIQPADDGKGGGKSKKAAEKSSVRISMDFPWRSTREVLEGADRAAILRMIQRAFKFSEESIMDDVLFVGIDSVGEDILVELKRERLLSLGYGSAHVNYDVLSTWGGGYTRGVILCCRATEEDRVITPTGDVPRIDFLSRFFGPKAGILEDPVTGSAHCTLAPYFGAKIGRANVVGRQISERGGVVECNLEDGAGEGEGRPRKVRIVGTAVLAVGGTLYV